MSPRTPSSRSMDPARRRHLVEQLEQPCPACGARPYAIAGPAVATTHDPDCAHLAALEPARRRGPRVELHPTPTAAATGLPVTVHEPDRQKTNHRLILVQDPALGVVSTFWHLDRGRRWRCSVHGYATHPDACPHIAAAAEHILPTLLGLPAGQVGCDA